MKVESPPVAVLALAYGVTEATDGEGLQDCTCPWCDVGTLTYEVDRRVVVRARCDQGCIDWEHAGRGR